jgi:hypothetical protein
MRIYARATRGEVVHGTGVLLRCQTECVGDAHNMHLLKAAGHATASADAMGLLLTPWMEMATSCPPGTHLACPLLLLLRWRPAGRPGCRSAARCCCLGQMHATARPLAHLANMCICRTTGGQTQPGLHTRQVLAELPTCVTAAAVLVVDKHVRKLCKAALDFDGGYPRQIRKRQQATHACCVCCSGHAGSLGEAALGDAECRYVVRF